MKATWLYRIAAILFVIFATGHTIGFLKFVPPTPEGQAVMNAMNTVQLQPGAAHTYGAFYKGFGLFATVYFLSLPLSRGIWENCPANCPPPSARSLGYFSPCRWSGWRSLGNIFPRHPSSSSERT